MSPKTAGRRRVESFEFEAERELTRLRQVLAEVLSTLPGDVSRASDVQQTLGVDKTLSWQVFRFTTATNVLAAGPALPGSAGLRRFLQAAGEKGLPSDLIRSANLALENFDRLVVEHAGDRATFNAMLSGLAGEDGEQIDVPCRRQAFRANSRILGIQAKTHLSCKFVQPSEADPTMMDVAAIRGFVRLRRNRRSAPLVLASARVSTDDGREVHPASHRPLDPDSTELNEIGLIPDFCSQPMPKLRRVEASSNIVNYEVDDMDIGKKSAVTCIGGQAWLQIASRYAEPGNLSLNVQTMVRMPSEVLVHDVLVHEELLEEFAPRARVYSDHRDVKATALRSEADVLPMQVSVEHLGRGAEVMHTPDVPRYLEMVRYALNRLGWESERFIVFRCRLEYPIVPSSVGLHFPLPQRP